MEEEIKRYLKENLKLNLHYEGDNRLVVAISLEGEEIAKDFIHYRIKK
jgi:hypothetical protein